MSEDPYDGVVVGTWFGEARYGEAREVIAWLNDEVLPRARASARFRAAEGLVEDATAATSWS